MTKDKAEMKAKARNAMVPDGSPISYRAVLRVAENDYEGIAEDWMVVQYCDNRHPAISSV